MEKFIKYGEKKGCSYVELKSNNSKATIIELEDNKIKNLSFDDSKLFCARVVCNGSEGLAYSNKEDFKSLIDNAMKLAKVIKKDTKFDSLPSVKKRIKTKYKINPLDVSLEDKKNDVLKLDIRKKFKNVSNISFTYREINNNLQFLSSEGRDINFDLTRVSYLALAHAKRGNTVEQFHKTYARHQGYEVMKKSYEDVDYAMDMSEKMLDAKHAGGGNFPVIIDQYLGGVFAHEAVGHGCEADLVLQNSSVMNDKLNSKIGTNNISIVDDGTKEILNGWVPVDNEGVDGHHTVLIKKGILQNYLQTRETAYLLKMKPTGNARAQNLTHRPIPRMTTTFVDVGDSNFDEMIKSIKDGYYLKGTAGGQTRPATGEFLFNAEFGYRIRNGELAEMVKMVSLGGNILQILNKINLVGKDLEFGQGTCGKSSQWVPVSDGAPHFKIDMVKVGGK